MFPSIPGRDDRTNRSDISWLSRPFFTLLTAACRSPDERERYDLPFFYWDCLTPSSRPIHPQENPNALIPRGNLFFFFFTIYLAMIYWLRLPPSQRITDPFWEIRFSHLSWVCMWHRTPEAVWGDTDFEERRSVNLCGVTPLLLSDVPLGWPCDSLLLPPSLSIVMHYLSVDKYSAGARFWYVFIALKTHISLYFHIISMQEALSYMSMF